MNTFAGNPDYIQISLNILRRLNRPLKFDIYVKRTEGSFTKIFKSGDLLDLERIRSYEEKGIEFFYVQEKDYETYTLYLERMGEVLKNKIDSLKSNDAADFLKELSLFTLQEMIVKTNVDERSFANANNVVDGCIQSIMKEPKTMLKIMKLMTHQPYQLKHSVAVSMFSVLLAKADGMESDQNIKNVGLGGFLHDIGIGQLTFDPEDEKILTPEQRKEMWRHPELGKQLLDQVKGVRSEVIQIVLQHHEQPNGHGYPNGLRGPEIFYPAKIVAIADTFCAMITKRSFRDAFTVEESLNRMRELQGKFDKKLLDVFTALMLPNK